MPLSGVDHNGVDYCLTEEFVSVYRMHPLMRDDLPVRSAADGRLLATVPADRRRDPVNLDSSSASSRARTGDFTDVLYLVWRGVIPARSRSTIIPNFLRELIRPDGERGRPRLRSTVMRDRERGVPRYNRFLQFTAQEADPHASTTWPIRCTRAGRELRRIYGQTDWRDNVDRIDLMVGLFCETPPTGFGFSDTAFRIFILMASRRLRAIASSPRISLPTSTPAPALPG